MNKKIRSVLKSIEDRVAVISDDKLLNYFNYAVLLDDLDSIDINKNDSEFLVYTDIGGSIIVDYHLSKDDLKFLEQEIEDFGWHQEDDEYIALMMIGTTLFYTDSYTEKEIKEELEDYNNYL